ncbi:FTR1 family protein [Aneurinibacillus sp. BA2021]|nr:FTR1 family protein [Aneurinibacillus sp. BA2021]
MAQNVAPLQKLRQIILAIVLIGGLACLKPLPAYAAPSASDILLPLAGNAVVEARAQHWQQVSADIEQFAKTWENISAQDSQIAQANRQKLDQAIADARAAVQGTPNPAAVSASLAALIKATDNLSGPAQAPADKGGKKEIEKLSVFLKRALAAVEQNDWEQAKSQYRQFDSGWTRAEGAIRTDSFAAYSNLETKMSLARVALNVQPPDRQKAVSALQSLLQAAQDYVSGKTSAVPQTAQGQSLSDLVTLLQSVSQDIAAGNAADAGSKMQRFIEVWPSVEGQVQTRSPKTYTDVEVQMAQALQFLSAAPPDLQAAQATVQTMHTELTPFVNAKSYTAFDAGMVLFREGLEALLVVAALLAFLRRTGNGDKQVWIWTGVGSGLAVSVGLAVIMTVFFSSAAAGGNRETIEGITGLIAVVMMFTVGAWLHSKSNNKAWSQYINEQMSTALAKGSLWSLTIVSFLAIAREGAETIIFYLGMASSIEKPALFLGIASALVILLLLGIMIIRFSVRIPIKPFFTVASLFIYYIALKFLGESIHVLQIENWIPAHHLSSLPSIGWLGFYPTWETGASQAFLLVLIAATMLWSKRKKLPQAALGVGK